MPKFKANYNTIIFGQTGSGKTHFILNVIRRKKITPFPKNIFYMYNIEQDFMKTWNQTEKHKIKFIQGLDFEKIDTSKPSLLVIDDLILSTNKEVAEMFILGSHHRQISLFFLTQNLYPRCDLYRLMSNNSHYFVLFQNQRNFNQIKTLAHQVYGKQDSNRILNAYKRAGEIDRGFVVLTFVPGFPSDLQVVTDWWEICPSIYL